MPAIPATHTADASPGGRVALYRFYDAHESLLYAGISNDPWRRRKQHAQTQPWYPQVRHQAITWYDTEWDARQAETRAIRDERPAFNVAGAIRPARGRMAVRPLWWANAAGVLLATMMLLTLGVVFTPAPGLRIVLVPCLIALSLAAPVAALVALILGTAPLITRFGAWAERNTVWPEVAE